MTLTEKNLSCLILFVNHGYPVSHPYEIWKSHPNDILNLCMYLHSSIFDVSLLHFVIDEGDTNKYNQMNCFDSQLSNPFLIFKEDFVSNIKSGQIYSRLKTQIQVSCPVLHRSHSKSSLVQTSQSSKGFTLARYSLFYVIISALQRWNVLLLLIVLLCSKCCLYTVCVKIQNVCVDPC